MQHLLNWTEFIIETVKMGTTMRCWRICITVKKTKHYTLLSYQKALLLVMTEPLIVKISQKIFQHFTKKCNPKEHHTERQHKQAESDVNCEHDPRYTSHSNVIAHCAEHTIPPSPTLRLYSLRLDSVQKLKMAVSSAVCCQEELSLAS